MTWNNFLSYFLVFVLFELDMITKYSSKYWNSLGDHYKSLLFNEMTCCSFVVTYDGKLYVAVIYVWLKNSYKIIKHFGGKLGGFSNVVYFAISDQYVFMRPYVYLWRESFYFVNLLHWHFTFLHCKFTLIMMAAEYFSIIIFL